MHSLFLLFRPFFLIALCGAISVGHAPAWLHLGICGEAAKAAVSVSEGTRNDKVIETTGTVRCSCHRDGITESSCSEDAQSSSPKDSHSHSSDDCILCQSLAHQAGTIQLDSPQCFSIAIGFEPFAKSELHLPIENASIPTPRGPPLAS